MRYRGIDVDDALAIAEHVRADAKSVQDLRNMKAHEAELLQVVAYPRYQFTVSELTWHVPA